LIGSPSASPPDLENDEENGAVILAIPINAEGGDVAVHHEQHRYEDEEVRPSEVVASGSRCPPAISVAQRAR
jgi:hypothetical protein